MTARLDAPVLALVDGSAPAANAAWRAALVARDHRVPLRLLHSGAAGGEHDAPRLAAALRERLVITVETPPCEGDPLTHAVRAAREASLLVIGSRRGNPLREFVLGTQAERLLRLCRGPVLVVKRPVTAGYRRVLVPVDLGAEASHVIATAGLFSRDPRMEVLHALRLDAEATLRLADASHEVLRRQRGTAEVRARLSLQELIADAGAGPNGARLAVTFGDAAASVLARERAMRADLVVLGKRQRGMLADFFLGGVTQRVLAAARADVLIVVTPAQAGARGAEASGRRPLVREA
ncbi:universal stress protein [Ramlibacter sp. G-1-2-2]|uniref:Universal stress protein n=1 Tax=Ramlibacter agri TaxID=2728837 RepID=A0A848HCS1_9BURK|nr:universal stress protein [Ramlibacter agri]NML46333.1 universal stress protein [Ramlibacter agri]